MRAIQIVDLSGPASALALVDVPEPQEPAVHMLTPGEGVLIDVHAAGVSFPEVLQTRGEYQLKPPLPFIPGSEVARDRAQRARRTRASRPASASPRSARSGAFAERAVAPPFLTFRAARRAGLRAGRGADPQLPHRLLRAASARAPARGRDRARPRRRRWCRHRGAAGRAGSRRAHDRGRIQRCQGAGRARRGSGRGAALDGPWKDEAKELSGGGVDVVLDPVGGDRFTDSLRSLREDGRLVVVGFTGGSIPEVKVNRLLLEQHRGRRRRLGRVRDRQARRSTARSAQALANMIERASCARSSASAFPLERAAEALQAIDERRATGKVVLDVQTDS